MNAAGQLGVGMLLVGSLLILVEILLLVPRALLLTKRLRELNLLVEGELRQANEQLSSIRRATAETAVLFRPYRKAWRWISHPITIALYQSFRRRSRNGSRKRSTQTPPTDRRAD
jgi:hypothetical protein